MKTGHSCEDVSKCECVYIEDEEFEELEGPGMTLARPVPKGGMAIAVGNVWFTSTLPGE